MEELRNISDRFDEDIYDAVSLKTCVEKRLTLGAPGGEAMKAVLAIYGRYLEEGTLAEIRA